MKNKIIGWLLLSPLILLIIGLLTYIGYTEGWWPVFLIGGSPVFVIILAFVTTLGMEYLYK